MTAPSAYEHRQLRSLLILPPQPTRLIVHEECAYPGAPLAAPMRFKPTVAQPRLSEVPSLGVWNELGVPVPPISANRSRHRLRNRPLYGLRAEH
jgi:hypothetical protein